VLAYGEDRVDFLTRFRRERIIPAVSLDCTDG